LIEESNVAFALSVAKEVENVHKPLNYFGIILFVDSEKWMNVMHEEMDSLEKNDTWEVVLLPPNIRSVKCKWIFKRKEGMTQHEAT
jgi:hypothetical protein